MYLFIDTETTGLPTKRNAHYTELAVWPRVVSISWALFGSANKCIRHEQHIVRPDGFVIPDDAAAIHGISNERALREGIPLNQVLQSLCGDIGTYAPQLLVAHNLAFDLPIVLSEMHRTGLQPILEGMPSCCTMELATEFCAIPHKSGQGYKWPNLRELHTKLFDRGFDGAHNAGADVLACARCYFQLQSLGVTVEKFHRATAIKPPGK